MAFVLPGNALLRPSSQIILNFSSKRLGKKKRNSLSQSELSREHSQPSVRRPAAKGAASSKLFSSQNVNRFSNVKLQQLSPRAASPVQQQSGTVIPQTQLPTSPSLDFTGVHHVGVICENLERSLEFYQGVLGLKINPDRPNDRLPYRGAWFWVGAEMIHVMELPNPDPLTGRPAYGGRDRHTCVALKSLDGLKIALEKAGIAYSQSSSGRPAMFARDPDGNCLEFTLVD